MRTAGSRVPTRQAQRAHHGPRQRRGRVWRLKEPLVHLQKGGLAILGPGADGWVRGADIPGRGSTAPPPQPGPPPQPRSAACPCGQRAPVRRRTRVAAALALVTAAPPESLQYPPRIPAVPTCWPCSTRHGVPTCWPCSTHLLVRRSTSSWYALSSGATSRSTSLLAARRNSASSPTRGRQAGSGGRAGGPADRQGWGTREAAWAGRAAARKVGAVLSCCAALRTRSPAAAPRPIQPATTRPPLPMAAWRLLAFGAVCQAAPAGGRALLGLGNGQPLLVQPPPQALQVQLYSHRGKGGRGGGGRAGWVGCAQRRAAGRQVECGCAPGACSRCHGAGPRAEPAGAPSGGACSSQGACEWWWWWWCVCVCGGGRAGGGARLSSMCRRPWTASFPRPPPGSGRWGAPPAPSRAGCAARRDADQHRVVIG